MEEIRISAGVEPSVPPQHFHNFHFNIAAVVKTSTGITFSSRCEADVNINTQSVGYKDAMLLFGSPFAYAVENAKILVSKGLHQQIPDLQIIESINIVTCTKAVNGSGGVNVMDLFAASK